MGRAISTDKTSTVNRKANGQFLDRHVMHDLVISTLKEGRINCTKRLHALSRKASSKSDRMLFSNANVKAAGGEAFCKFIYACT